MRYLRDLGTNFEKLLSYLISAPSNWSYCKAVRKNKNTQIWEQIWLVWVFFWLGFFGQTLFEVITLEFAKNEILTHTVSFGKGSAFSKGQRSTLPEVAGLGPGPFYKACLS